MKMNFLWLGKFFVKLILQSYSVIFDPVYIYILFFFCANVLQWS